MKNNVTELVFILDRSGSMAGLEKDTVGGFNSMIEKQKREQGECFVSTVLFNGECKVIHDRMKLSEIRSMTDADYVPCGCTALVDAVGCAIRHIGNIHKYARPGDVPDRTAFIIMTDGMENASHIFNADELRRMIGRQKSKYGWEFLFLGANIDAVETAKHYGIDRDRAVKFHSDSVGTAVNYEAVNDAVGQIRCGAPLGSNWKRAIERDYKSRK